MKRSVLAGYYTVAALFLALLTGCGRPADVESQPETKEVNAQQRLEDFAVTGKLEEESALWAGQYLPWEHRSQIANAGTGELSRLDFGVCGDLIWYLGREQTSDLGAETDYTLEIYDTVNGESTIRQFSPKELGLEEELGALYSMDMLETDRYVFRWTAYEQDEEGMYRQTTDRMVYTDFSDSLQSVDLRESYLEKGLYQEESTEHPLPQFLNWRCDGKGNICVTDYREDGSFAIYLFDQGGQALLEYEGTAEQWLVEPLRTSDGELIFPVYDNTEKYYEFLWADSEKAELHSLAQMASSYPDIRQMYGMLGDDIYYRSQEISADGIVKWNVKTGRRVRVFDYRAAGIDTGYEIMLALREGQTPVLHLSQSKEGKQREWLSALMEQKPAEDGAIRVVDLVSDGESKAQVAACAVLTSINTPDFRYEYEDASASEERDRIMVELAQGKGPDLLFVSLEDMYLLEEKGLLLDIGELIPGELKEELLPGALEIGAVDERLPGVPVAVRADTFAVSTGTWPADTWKLEDVINLMDEGKLTGAIRMMTGKYTEPSLTVLVLVKRSLHNSFLIDWESRKCHFDDERFIRLLELTSTDLKNTPPDPEVWLNDGKDILWGSLNIEADFLDFFAHMEAEGGNIVGYPTEEGCGSYLVAEGGVLVVNANIAQKEAAACFLETLLGKELQSKTSVLCMSVRKLNPEDYIVEEESGRLVYMGGINAPEVPVFDDGSTALHRAKAFLESCVAPPPEYSQISKIIAEELRIMHAENRSPKDTADFINSRVQVYLDEGN